MGCDSVHHSVWPPLMHVLGHSLHFGGASGKMNISCFGLSHQTASVEVRERFAIADSALSEALLRLKAIEGVDEGLIVSTCNRTEFYVAGPISQLPAARFFEGFYKGLRTGDQEHLFGLWAERCVHHLFRVV